LGNQEIQEAKGKILGVWLLRGWDGDEEGFMLLRTAARLDEMLMEA
jgi:hypothetical protein